MAFDASRLRLVQIAQGGDLPNSWYYYTTDAIETVLASGYFNGAPTEKMRVGDLIRVFNPTVDDNYALEVETLSPITTAIANATGIDIQVQGLLGEFIVDAYSPDYDAGDAAFVAAYEAGEAFKVANPGATSIIRFTHNIRMRESHELETSNTHIVANPGVEIYLDEDIGDGVPLFTMAVQPDGNNTLVNETSIPVGTLTLTFTSVTGFAAGDYVAINSQEYFSGITGVTGFQVQNKGERLRIKRIVGLDVTFYTGTADSYDCVTYPVSATKENLLTNFRFEGMTAVGTGVEGVGPSFIDITSAANVFCDVAFRLCGRGSVQWKNVDSFTVRGNTGPLLGFDPEDEEEESVLYGGHDFNACTNGYIEGLKGSRLRRLVNIDTKEGAIVISRSITCIGFKPDGNLNGFGTHMCDDIAFFNCVGDNFYYRGKNPTLIGCEMRSYGTSTTSTSVLLGQTKTAAFTENPSLGKVNIQDNKCFAMNAGMIFRMTVDGGIIANNKFDIKGHGLWFYGKVSRDLKISDNYFDRSRGTIGGALYGVYFENRVALNLPELVTNIMGRGNHFINFVRAWRVDGSSDINVPWTNIIEDGSSQDAGNDANISFMIFENGSFGANCGAQNCTGSGPYSEQFVSAGGDISFFQQMLVRHNNTVPGEYPITGLIQSAYSLGNRRTIVQGQAVEIYPPPAGDYAKYICLTSGTTGTFPAVTADIASGDDQLEFTADPNSGTVSCYPGCFLTIIGADSGSGDLEARVIAYDAGTLTATLDVDAGTTVVAATVNYTVPVVKGTMMMEA